MEAYRVPY